jgi:hypothetical protein
VSEDDFRYEGIVDHVDVTREEQVEEVRKEATLRLRKRDDALFAPGCFKPAYQFLVPVR